MPIWIVEVQLLVPIRALLYRRGDPHAMLQRKFPGFGYIVDGEREVMPARDNRITSLAPAGLTRFRARLRCVNLRIPNLEPQARKPEGRPRDLPHPEKIDIESARGIQVGAYDRDMIKRRDTDERLPGHALIIAQRAKLRRPTRTSPKSAAGLETGNTLCGRSW